MAAWTWEQHLGRLLAALTAAVLLTGLLNAPVDAVPRTGTGAADRVSAAAQTRVTVKALNCAGCRLKAYWVRPDYSAWTQHRRVHDGRAVFRVPRRYTKGLQFEVVSPKRTVYFRADGLRQVVFRYEGRAVGKRVSHKQAANARRAYGCWRGTSKTKMTLQFRLERFKARDAYTGVLGWEVRAYMTRGKPTTGTLRPAPRGALGGQDWGRCN